jgi:hypothetical protein
LLSRDIQETSSVIGHLLSLHLAAFQFRQFLSSVTLKPTGRRGA